jgi:hypothetical protein
MSECGASPRRRPPRTRTVSSIGLAETRSAGERCRSRSRCFAELNDGAGVAWRSRNAPIAVRIITADPRFSSRANVVWPKGPARSIRVGAALSVANQTPSGSSASDPWVLGRLPGLGICELGRPTIGRQPILIQTICPGWQPLPVRHVMGIRDVAHRGALAECRVITADPRCSSRANVVWAPVLSEDPGRSSVHTESALGVKARSPGGCLPSHHPFPR